MTPSERRLAYAGAFIKQARSDWAVHLKLVEMKFDDGEVPMCHSLHYLQMATEKLAKAYRLRDTDAEVDDLVKKHTGFEKFIGAFGLTALRDDYVGRTHQHKSIVHNLRTLAKEVERFAPATDRTATPENVEYPWERGEEVIAPCGHGFPTVSMLREASGRLFLKVVGRAMRDFEEVTIR